MVEVESRNVRLAAVNARMALFSRSGTTWAQQAYLKASNTGASDLFGIAVVSGTVNPDGAVFSR